MKSSNSLITKMLMSDWKPASNSVHVKCKKTSMNSGTESFKWPKMRMPESDQEFFTSFVTAVQPDSSNKFTKPYKNSTMTGTQISEEPVIRSWPPTKELASGTFCEIA